MAIEVYEVTPMEWWAGESAQAVLDAYTRASGDVPTALPRALTDEEMTRLTMVHDSEGEVAEERVVTFREQLDLLIATGHKFPSFFELDGWL